MGDCGFAHANFSRFRSMSEICLKGPPRWDMPPACPYAPLTLLLIDLLCANARFESTYARSKKQPIVRWAVFLVGDCGFEPQKALPADLQSVPFGHSGNLPLCPANTGQYGAGGRNRTPDLLITSQLLYLLSYTSFCAAFLRQLEYDII